MPCLPINYDVLASVAGSHDPTKPIYMLNLWKFRAEAAYLPEHAALAGPPCTGREAMTRYRTAILSVAPPGAAEYFVSSVLTEVVAPKGESWDTVVLVRYDKMENFKKMVECKKYKESIEPHRLAALEDFRLIMLDKRED
jgi:hypothetical protein